MSKKVSLVILLFAILLIVYVFTGFLIIQPIGALPEGATIWYFRFGLNTSFISSADGILLKSNQGVSLLGRAVVLSKMSEVIINRKIIKIPYNHRLYLISTEGVELDR